mmetsp:Transcript_4303/g.15470  ORF Transcript_4303/g.15470 Transcript_4303/m.15470 type:complete len:246 (-) Transcript_4303:606-1343(-)
MIAPPGGRDSVRSDCASLPSMSTKSLDVDATQHLAMDWGLSVGFLCELPLVCLRSASFEGDWSLNSSDSLNDAPPDTEEIPGSGSSTSTKLWRSSRSEPGVAQAGCLHAVVSSVPRRRWFSTRSWRLWKRALKRRCRLRSSVAKPSLSPHGSSFSHGVKFSVQTASCGRTPYRNDCFEDSMRSPSWSKLLRISRKRTGSRPCDPFRNGAECKRREIGDLSKGEAARVADVVARVFSEAHKVPAKA